MSGIDARNGVDGNIHSGDQDVNEADPTINLRKSLEVFELPTQTTKSETEGGQDMKNDFFETSSEFYDDFHAINWQSNLAIARKKRRRAKRRSKSAYGALQILLDDCSGWICCVIIGVVLAFIAAAVDYGVAWTVGLRLGACIKDIWKPHSACCSSRNRTLFDVCTEFAYWPWFINKSWLPMEIHFQVVAFLLYVILGVTFAGTAAVIVKNIAPRAEGSGIPEIKTILCGYVIRGYLEKPTLIAKTIGLIFSVGSGLSLGKEGPFVHIACCVGNVVSRYFPQFAYNEAKRREILSASAAAGVSVAFGAPLGGVMFSLEEASYYFPMCTLWRSFFCAVVAASVLKYLNSEFIVFKTTFTGTWTVIEILPFCALGVIGGVVGCILSTLNARWLKARQMSWRRGKPIFEVLCVAALTAVLSYPNPYTRMNASELIKLLFTECTSRHRTHLPLCDYDHIESTDLLMAGRGVYESLWQLTLAMSLKIGFTIITFGLAVPAGIFIPALAIGALFGRIVGMSIELAVTTHRNHWVSQLVCSSRSSCIPVSLYAVVGASACLAGITRMTVSLVVIMFELTGKVENIIPIMCSVVCAKWVADGLQKEGFYEFYIRLKGYPYLDPKIEYSLPTKAGQIMKPRPGDPTVDVIPFEGWNVRELSKLLQSTDHAGYPVTLSEANRILVGYVYRKELQLAMAKACVGGVLRKDTKVSFNPQGDRSGLNLSKVLEVTSTTVTRSTPMAIVVDLFVKLGISHVLVTDLGEVVGLLTKKDVVHHVWETERDTASQFM